MHLKAFEDKKFDGLLMRRDSDTPSSYYKQHQTGTRDKALSNLNSVNNSLNKIDNIRTSRANDAKREEPISRAYLKYRSESTAESNPDNTWSAVAAAVVAHGGDGPKASASRGAEGGRGLARGRAAAGEKAAASSPVSRVKQLLSRTGNSIREKTRASLGVLQVYLLVVC